MNKFFITCFALFLTPALMAQTDVAPDATGMEMDAQTWTRDVRMGWNLGNALESSGADWDDATGTWKNTWVADYNQWETGWGNPKTTKAMIHAVAEAGFNAIRVPVRWVPHITDYSTMTIDPAWIARVKQVVDWCLEENLYVVLNTHHELWLEYHPFTVSKAEINRKLKALWTNIATYFRDYDEKLIFAGINEVQVNWKAPTAENQEVQNSFLQTFVDAVRATGGKNYYRNLVVQTYSCNPSYGLNGMVVPTDVVQNRLSVEFHYYDPYDYCSGAASSYFYWGKEYADKGTVSPSGNEQTIKNLFRQISKKWMSQGLGIVIGEYGVSNHYQTANQAIQQENMKYYLTTLVSEARKHGFAAFVWDNNAFGNGSEKFGIFDRNNNMNVRNAYFLEGIQEGSLTEYDESSSQDEVDPGTGGKVLWTGDELLDWNQGLQLYLAADEFAEAGEGCKLVLYYSQHQADYEDIQLFYGDWSAMIPYSVQGNDYVGDFFPRDYYGSSNAELFTAFEFSTNVYQTLCQKGVVIQGHGLNLTKAVLVSASTDINGIHVDAPDAPAYMLNGMKAPKHHHGIIIVNGRKYVR